MDFHIQNKQQDEKYSWEYPSENKILDWDLQDKFKLG